MVIASYLKQVRAAFSGQNTAFEKEVVEKPREIRWPGAASSLNEVNNRCPETFVHAVAA